MKVTCRSGRYDISGKHNDRNFNLNYADHIDQNRMEDNKYYTYDNDYSLTLADNELRFYKAKFGEHIQEQNEKNNAARKSSRNKTVQSYHRSDNTRPEDVWLQVGDKNEHISGEQLWEIANEYRKQFEAQYGSHCKILNMSLHMDEETPHVHVRRVWMSQDSKGKLCVGQNKALKDLGIERPNPEQKSGKFNNAKMTFTMSDQKMFYDICREHGLDVDAPPAKTDKNKRKHLNDLDFKIKGDEERVQELEREITGLKSSVREIDATVNMLTRVFTTSPAFEHMYDGELLGEEFAKKTRREKLERLMKILREETKAAQSQNISQTLLLENAKRGYRLMEQFIDDTKQREEYDKYVEEKTGMVKAHTKART